MRAAGSREHANDVAAKRSASLAKPSASQPAYEPKRLEDRQQSQRIAIARVVSISPSVSRPGKFCSRVRRSRANRRLEGSRAIDTAIRMAADDRVSTFDSAQIFGDCFYGFRQAVNRGESDESVRGDRQRRAALFTDSRMFQPLGRENSRGKPRLGVWVLPWSLKTITPRSPRDLK